jgi:Leucine-rich repeat (LRR) protein
MQALPRNLDYLYTLRKFDVSNNGLTNLWMPRPVEELNISENPLTLPNTDPKGSLFVRMAAEPAHARWIRSVNASRLNIIEIPVAFSRFRGVTTIDLSNNAIKVGNVCRVHGNILYSNIFDNIDNGNE